MYYEPGKMGEAGLEHDPFKSLAAPRPIGWISTISTAGVNNLAPYSFFNAVSTDPHVVFFASQSVKDSQRNAEGQGEFVCNLASWGLREQMNLTSAGVDPSVDEAELAGLEMEASRLVKPMRVKGSPAHFECEYMRTVDLGGNYGMVLGRVLGVHVNDEYVRDASAGWVDTAAMRLIARMGRDEYAVVESAFSMTRPASGH